MKRPDGFGKPGGLDKANGSDKAGPKSTPGRSERIKAGRPGATASKTKAAPAPSAKGTPARKTSPVRQPSAVGVTRDGAQRRDARREARLDRAHARKAARARRRYERGEVRRFTRRSRRRRIAWLTALVVVAALITAIAVTVYSPILALRTIRIEGTSRVDPVELHAAVESQLGTPLALLDFDRITTELGAFPLIRSYVTQAVPPDTLVITVVERQPVGSLRVGAVHQLIDPAGVVIETSVDRIPGVPVIDLAGKDTSAPVFDAVVEVLLALPQPLLAQVDTVSATTRDDVVLVLAGVGQRVAWGSAERSTEKAAVLAALISVTDPARAGEFDVSAPGNAVFRPG